MPLCSICLGNYVDPRVLPCGHSFCLVCLQKLHKPRCPLCQKQFSCVEELVANYALSAVSRARHDCTTCRYSKELWCCECAILICQVAKEDNWHHDHHILTALEAHQYMVDKLGERAEEVKEAYSTLATRANPVASSASKYLATTAENLAIWQARKEQLVTAHQQAEAVVLRSYDASLQKNEQVITTLLADEAHVPLSTMAAFLAEPLPELCLQKQRKELRDSLIELNKEFLAVFAGWMDREQEPVAPVVNDPRHAYTLGQAQTMLRDPLLLQQALDTGLSPDSCVQGQPPSRDCLAPQQSRELQASPR